MRSTPFSRTDIVNSATPLETQFEGIHPRLYADAAGLDAARARTTGEPWAGFLARVLRQAEIKESPDFTGDLRPYGDWLAHLAAAFRMTREPAYLEKAKACIAAMAGRPDWTRSLQYGHWAHGMALAYDWLYDELDEPLRALIRRTLADRTERVYALLTSYSNAYSLAYAWNHMGVVHGGLLAAGCALWGEVDGAGRWIKLALEKLRLMVDALGPDGASAEGQAYGQYHLDYLLKSLLHADRLLGEDFFASCPFLKNYPLYMIHSQLPRHAWRPMQPDRFPKAFIQVSDTDGVHWHGPDVHLRIAASRYRDGLARWLADETAAAGVCADSSCFLNLLTHDETVPPVKPDALAPFRHFADKDLVLMRSGWEPDAAVAVFKCGPNSGHHAARRFRHNVAGGHMHPDAGHLMIHAFGDWLLRDDGYTRKMTAYQNTVLVNGLGQTGEGGDWFEDLEMRRGKPEGRILTAEHLGRYDRMTGDAAPAYHPAARLKTFLRHLVYVRPHLWILVDELEAEADSIFEQRFHAPSSFVPIKGTDQWSMSAGKGALRILPLGPSPCRGRAFRDVLRGNPPSYPDQEVEALALSNPEPARSALFVVLLQARPAEHPDAIQATLVPKGAGWQLDVQGPEAISLVLGQGATPAPVTRTQSLYG